MLQSDKMPNFFPHHFKFFVYLVMNKYHCLDVFCLDVFTQRYIMINHVGNCYNTVITVIKNKKKQL